MTQVSRLNGRRGWRRWAKSRRRHMNEHHRKLYQGAVMRKKQPERAPIRAQPPALDHLVGMTQGARKRAARSIAKRYDLKPYMLHEELQVGQRLRRCPGCADCHPNRKLYRLKTTNRVLQTMAGTAYPSLMEAEIIREERCGGSKLIEARKSRPKP